MNLRNNHRIGTRLASVALCLGGLLAASVSVAGDNDYRGHGSYNDDDDNYGYHNRNRREPRFFDRGDTLEAKIDVRGLRRGRSVRAELEATAEVEIECQRRGRGHGHGHGHGNRYTRKIDIEVDGTEYYSSRHIRGNRLYVEVETDELEYELHHYYGNVCPGHSRGRVESVRFSDAKLEIRQGGRDVVTWLCSFDYDTRNGEVPRRNVDCVTLY